MENNIETLFNRKNKKEGTNEKTFIVNMNESLFNKMDETLRTIKEVKGEFCSRSTFVEQAVDCYLNNIENELQILQCTKTITSYSDQVIVFTCSEKANTYNTMFQNRFWSCVSLGKEVVNAIQSGHIKYFALYRGKPRQYIDSYAEIININKLPNGKYEFKLGEIQPLPNPVSLNGIEPSSIMKGRKISLEKLLTSTEIDTL
ncbi:hypothetical protein CLOHAE12215_01430 [Clostridium haemolyticum]|uniref:Uncharacterized protein n=1 Tax=Clostridium botulinum D str. 1873 TaxID=592027 RepID=A0A9P2LK99_CLOBO|nr:MULTISPECIES: hypothetical protein [Clostridium]EES90278.1 hypothetical protein CLG_B2240 [Clostridium phage D-1873]MCD3216940.1 hypothetical protein [Clostridium botulinum C]MCD3245358.1 hypothetical protein [Clostridium botulinum C]MCD3261737.1 hypothetical protein [Clostridium botulinum C]NFV47899.1 hypothetical protein [Clostridium botulinum]